MDSTSIQQGEHMKKIFLLLITLFIGNFLFIKNSWAADSSAKTELNSEQNALDNLNPFASDIEQTLKKMDNHYQNETGLSPFLTSIPYWFNSDCYRQTCIVWAQIIKSQQKLILYINSNPVYTWDVSTGVEDYETPDFETHPDGRIYESYTSTVYPGGDYHGLGNMPYAVFISGGFAIHGTGEKNWPKLGRPASHGCIRLHPDNAFKFNRLVRKYGIENVWITVE